MISLGGADQLSFEGKSFDIFWLRTKIWHGNKWLGTPWKCMVCSTETNYLADGRQITRLGNLAWFSLAFFKGATFSARWNELDHPTKYFFMSFNQKVLKLKLNYGGTLVTTSTKRGISITNIEDLCNSSRFVAIFGK